MRTTKLSVRLVELGMERRNQQETVSALLAGSAESAPVGSLTEMLALPEKVAA